VHPKYRDVVLTDHDNNLVIDVFFKDGIIVRFRNGR